MSNEEIRELRKISKILVLTNSSIIERELSKFASTNERKKIWVLIDGERMPKDLAAAAKVTPQAVSYFLTAGKAAQLIDYSPREPPRRVLDYVPPSWLDLVDLSKPAEELSSQQKSESQAEQHE